jgi:hypothetical protein
MSRGAEIQATERPGMTRTHATRRRAMGSRQSAALRRCLRQCSKAYHARASALAESAVLPSGESWTRFVGCRPHEPRSSCEYSTRLNERSSTTPLRPWWSAGHRNPSLPYLSPDLANSCRTALTLVRSGLHPNRPGLLANQRLACVVAGLVKIADFEFDSHALPPTTSSLRVAIIRLDCIALTPLPISWQRIVEGGEDSSSSWSSG